MDVAILHLQWSSSTCPVVDRKRSLTFRGFAKMNPSQNKSRKFQLVLPGPGIDSSEKPVNLITQ